MFISGATFRNLFNRFIFVIAYIFGVTHIVDIAEYYFICINKKRHPNKMPFFFFTFDFFKFADLISSSLPI